MNAFRKFLGGYVRLIAGLITLIFGLVSLFLPFLPLGYILLFASVYLLATYIPPLKKLLEYLREKDKKNVLDKVERKITKWEDKIAGKSDQSEGNKM